MFVMEAKKKIKITAKDLKFYGPDLSSYPKDIYEKDVVIGTTYWDWQELTTNKCCFGTVCYVIMDQCPALDLFVIIDYVGEESEDVVSRNKGQLKVIFPQVTIVEGEVVLGQDRLDKDTEAGVYKIYQIDLSIPWYIGCASLDKEFLEGLDAPLGYFEQQ